MQTTTVDRAKSAQTPSKTTKKDEKILVVPRTKLFPETTIQGLVQFDEKQLHETIKNHKQFLWRSKVENDPSYKQIIPYLVFRFKNTLFLMQRAEHSSEQRLKSKFTLGIGGHIREKDIQNASIIDWAAREFDEEIRYAGRYKAKFIGLLNDEIDAVGQVHTGCVYLLDGDSPDIHIKSELQHGSLASLTKCTHLYKNMERWSQIVFDFIGRNRNEST